MKRSVAMLNEGMKDTHNNENKEEEEEEKSP